MSTTLTLKERQAGNTATIPVDAIQSMMQQPAEEARDSLYAVFANMSPTQHDVKWLHAIVDWAPEAGLPVTELARWLPLAEKVNAVQPEGETDIELTDEEVDLIYSRLADERFKLTGLPPALVSFLADLQTATGRPITGD